MNTSIVQEQKENVHYSLLIGNDKLNGYISDPSEIPSANVPLLQDNDYLDNAIVLGNPIEMIKRISYAQSSSIVTTGSKAKMEKKISIFTKVKTILKI